VTASSPASGPRLCDALPACSRRGVTAGYHRYFSHRTYKTSRVFQFLLAFLAETTAQKGVLWWASHHRNHHKHSDQVGDTHSPCSRASGTRTWAGSSSSTPRAPTLAHPRPSPSYPELMWLNKYFLVPPTLLAIGCSLIAFGWPGLFIGFFLSTVLCWHITFLVNSLAHVSASAASRPPTPAATTGSSPCSRWARAGTTTTTTTMSSTRQGFYWWEIDMTYYVLRLLAVFGIVWDLRPVPPAIIAEGRAIDAAARR
jgi:stearoyl-CoA desaturase (delta-9 desaturase)